MRRRSMFWPLFLLVLAALLAPTGTAPLAGRKAQLRVGLDFAADMAKRGNWREARYRWEKASTLQPDNPRILNNLAVACEVLDEPDRAADHYERAMQLSGRDARIQDNNRRFQRFREMMADSENGGQEDSSAAHDGGLPVPATESRSGKDAFRVVARFKMPARLDLEGFENLLVASFLTEETALLNSNREITRFLRGEFRKRSPLEVLEVTPAPAIPEQTVEDLIANDAFWRHLGKEYDADLIVSGVVHYDRQDHSGFRDVDMVSPVTGQKVRRTRFVEEELFIYSMEVFFFDGATGNLLYRDSMQRSAIFQGTSNDALAAFYGLVESIARDVLSVVSPRVREDTRIIFRD